MTRPDSGGEIRFGWSKWWLALRGAESIHLLVLIVLIALLVMVWDLRQTFPLTMDAFAKDHRTLAKAVNVQSCMASLTPDEKLGLREAAKREGWERAVNWLCPWMPPS